VVASPLQQKIVAVDLKEEFLSQLRSSAAQKGMTHLIETQCGTAALQDGSGAVNLIWSEGDCKIRSRRSVSTGNLIKNMATNSICCRSLLQKSVADSIDGGT
jgi:hypothetical protein